MLPISGTVGHIAVNTGSYASPGKPLMENCGTIQRSIAISPVYEADLYKVKSGQQVRFTLTNNSAMEFYGEIFGINKSFEDAGKGIIVHCIIKGANKYGLIPGTYVTALISVGTQLSPSCTGRCRCKYRRPEVCICLEREG